MANVACYARAGVAKPARRGRAASAQGQKTQRTFPWNHPCDGREHVFVHSRVKKNEGLTGIGHRWRASQPGWGWVKFRREEGLHCFFCFFCFLSPFIKQQSGLMLLRKSASPYENPIVQIQFIQLINSSNFIWWEINKNTPRFLPRAPPCLHPHPFIWLILFAGLFLLHMSETEMAVMKSQR